LVLIDDPVTDCAQVVAEVDAAGGLYAGENSFFAGLAHGLRKGADRVGQGRRLGKRSPGI